MNRGDRLGQSDRPLKERTYLTDYSSIYDIELVFIELPKFQKELPDLETLMDKWLYSLYLAY